MNDRQYDALIKHFQNYKMVYSDNHTDKLTPILHALDIQSILDTYADPQINDVLPVTFNTWYMEHRKDLINPTTADMLLELLHLLTPVYYKSKADIEFRKWLYDNGNELNERKFENVMKGVVEHE